jgi:hypothetical protein
MSLNIARLEKVRRLAGGVVQARCPACAEGGHDRTGEHLRVYPDGKFGCCVYPKDREHRKRIFALVGLRERQDIRVKAVAGPVAKAVHRDVLGRLGRVFGGPVEPAAPTAIEVGTLGTPQYPYTCERKSEFTYIYKGFCKPVPSVPRESGEAGLDFETPVPSVPTAAAAVESETGVPSVPEAEGALPPIAAGEKLPYLTPGGTLVIPFDAPERYHWWKGGQSVAETLAEVKRRMNYGDNV